MSVLSKLLHLDKTLIDISQQYQTGTYLLLFLIIFCETGLVFTPFLPGDSLLFAAGVVAAMAGSPLNIGLLILLLIVAAFAGDNTNYWVGKLIGERLFRNPNSRFLKRENVDKTHAFFERYGGKTIILARFVPIVRTFAPFVAGLGAMTYPRFLTFSAAAAALWVGLCCSFGYFFGGLPIVKKHFELVLVVIVLISVLPMAVEFIKHRKQSAEPAEELAGG
jgi:membrane-associated protein